MNEVYLLNVSMFEDKGLFEKGMQMISSDRAEKIRKFQNPSAARLSLGAGILLSFVFEKHGLKEKLNEIQTGKHGKPYLPGIDFHFSLSHSGEYALCAVSDIPVGADLQKIKDKLPDKTKKILSATEEEYLQRLSPIQKRDAFYRLWAKKESMIKWDGRGLRLPLHEISFVQEGCMQNSLIYEGKQLFFQEYDLIFPEYSICLCSKRQIFAAKVEEITTDFLTKY